MRHYLNVKRFAAAALLLGSSLGLGGCSTFSNSPIDQAYYTGGALGAKAYTRTIFSSNDF